MFGWKTKTSGAGSKTARLKSTRNYIYFPDHKLGDGATSSVYLGRNKKNGEKVAVKVFNSSSYHRPGQVQDREFEVLHKLKHDNIVGLLAIEDDTGTKERTLIMELCDCSVFNMLEKPEYYFGFQEDEFLGILKDITAGMKYLQDMEIVHRDIKPGNIMRRLGGDKRPSFKLADFGAARELEEGEQFQSLYGTEEYLHPDMYGRALLRKTPNNPFTSKVDLWSLGVTIYHIATGTLPFRPFGGRKNKRKMYEMTSKKSPGVISAVQRNSEHGPIQYSKELPTECHLSDGIRQLVTAMLAGLLECNPHKMWSFQTYFETTQRIFTMKRFFVFSTERSQLLRIYSEPDFTLAEVQEQIAAQTNIAADRQVMVHDGNVFHPDSTTKCKNYPETSEQSPVILCQRGCINNTSDPVLPYTPPMPTVSTSISLESDYTVAKASVAVLTYMVITQRTFFVICDLYTSAAKTFSGIVKSHIGKLQYNHALTKGLRTTMETLLQTKQREVANILTLLDGYMLYSNGNRTELEECRRKLNSVRQEISKQEDSLNLMDLRFQKVDRLLNDLLPYLVDKDPITKWDPGQICKRSDRCSERLEVYQEETQNIFETFKEDRHTARLAYNDEQVHKMAKQKLRDVSDESTKLLHGHCRNNLRKSHVNFAKWFLSLSEIRSKIDELDEQLTPLSKHLTEIHSTAKQAADTWTASIDVTVAKLSTLLTTPVTEDPKPKIQNQCVRDDDLETDGSLSDQPRSIVLYRPGSSLAFSSEDNEQLVLVPQALKKELESVKAESAAEAIQQSRQLLRSFEALSCSVVSLELSDIELSDDDDDAQNECLVPLTWQS